MLPRLLQVNALARTIERHLALLSATLRTDAPMHRWTEAFFFPFFADDATQSDVSPSIIPRKIARLSNVLKTSPKLAKRPFRDTEAPKQAIFLYFRVTYYVKPRKMRLKS